MTAARDDYRNEASSNNEVMSQRAASTLLQAGADGVTALLTLARQDDTRALKRLIEAGVDKVRDAQGKTALMRAVELTSASGDNGEMALKALKTLLAAGADITIQDNEGKTAQEHAAILAAASKNKKALRAFSEAATPKRSVIARMFGR